MSPNEIEANRNGDVTLRLLQSDQIVLGVQVFNELCNVALRRKLNWRKTQQMLASLQTLSANIVPQTLDVRRRGIRLHERYMVHFHDALMLAAALKGGCATFYSEDMRHSQVIEKVMKIKNPFRVE